MLSAITVGCRVDIEPDDVSPLILTMAVDIQQNTKASHGKTAFVNDDEVSVWVTSTRGTSLSKLQPAGNYADNNKFKFNSATNKLEPANSKITFPSPTAKLGVYAISPYSSSYKLADVGNVTVLEHSVKSDQSNQTNFLSSDIMTASKGFTGYSASDMNNPTAMTFYHRLSKFDITVKAPASYGNSTFVKVNYVKVKNHIATAKVPMSVASANDEANLNGTGMTATTNGSAVQDITMHNYDTPADDNGYKVRKYEAITVPQTIATNTVMIEVSVTYTGEDKLFYYMTGSNIPFSAGNSHKLTLAIDNLKPIVFSKIEVSEWNATDSEGDMEDV